MILFANYEEGGSGSLTSFTAPQDGLLHLKMVYRSLPKVYCSKDEIGKEVVLCMTYLIPDDSFGVKKK